ncbi:hypothetical protein QP903_03325 [Corynebacterium pseudodiphtheriticum]|uniref:hypothetical protein n=1 Tax=Corynebacterium pseudodiphtheriticum TaxID=37637 RepID=UPI00254E686D|nr:hypothetical protein [Corynebacterium pseudodiphtheriticum]MDK8545362.1 hypothetical protein [Corynebacterium pseudodiphtheriticum]
MAAVSFGTIQSQAHAEISGIRENCFLKKKMRIHNIASIVLALIAIILTITEIASTLATMAIATLALIVFISGAETRKR